MDMYPRNLNESNLIGYCLPSISPSFKEGDIVRLKTGTAPIRVEVSSGRYLTGQYVNSETRVVARKCDDFVLHEDYNDLNKTEGTTMTNTNTLFEITLDDSTDSVYGHYLATNSSGKWVMEEKGTGKIHTVDKASVQEVLPHTIGVQFLDGGVGKTYSYFAEKGQFNVNDLYVINNSLAVVVAVDTKSKQATKSFEPTLRVVTQTI
jgi:hypothetical protein